MPQRRRTLKENNSKQGTGWNQGTGAFGRSSSQYLTFENQDYANNALDFTFNMTLTRQTKEEESKQKIATTPKNEGFKYQKGCVSHVSMKTEA